MDCLALFALNVSTCFATELKTLCKSTSHSAHRSLELDKALPCGSHPPKFGKKNNPDTRPEPFFCNKKLPRLGSNQQPTG